MARFRMLAEVVKLSKYMERERGSSVPHHLHIHTHTHTHLLSTESLKQPPLFHFLLHASSAAVCRGLEEETKNAHCSQHEPKLFAPSPSLSLSLSLSVRCFTGRTTIK